MPVVRSAARHSMPPRWRAAPASSPAIDREPLDTGTVGLPCPLHRGQSGRGNPLLALAAGCDDRRMTTRRFPPPWRAEKMPGGYVVRDANDQALAYVYSRANEAEAMQAKVLTDDEARRVAVNIARLPALLQHGE
jgi:hypothetical protein